jgi:hypothetical protein
MVWIIIIIDLITEVKSVIAIPEEFPFYTSETADGKPVGGFVFSLKKITRSQS